MSVPAQSWPFAARPAAGQAALWRARGSRRPRESTDVSRPTFHLTTTTGDAIGRFRETLLVAATPGRCAAAAAGSARTGAAAASTRAAFADRLAADAETVLHRPPCPFDPLGEIVRERLVLG